MNRQRLVKWLALQIALSVFMMLPSVFFFMQASAVSPLGNIVGIPLVQFFILPLSILTVILSTFHPDLSQIFFNVTANFFEFFWDYAQWITQGNWVWSVHLTNWVLPTFLLGLLGTVFADSWQIKALSLLFFLPLFQQFWQADHEIGLGAGDFEIVFLDVGQGTAVFARTAKHTLLYDAGPMFPSGFNTGDSVVVPYLRHHNIRRIDMVVISHNDIDHSGGIAAVLKNHQVKKIFSGEPYTVGGDQVANCHLPLSWQWNSVQFRFLPADVSGKFNGNNASCILRISHGSQSVLLTGDIEKSAEYALLTSYMNRSENPLKSKWLLAPHHGSKSSSSAAFLNAVSMKNVVFSSGYLNHFGFPHQDVVRKYQSRDTIIWKTWQSGQIKVRFLSSGKTEVTTSRCAKKKYWHERVLCR